MLRCDDHHLTGLLAVFESAALTPATLLGLMLIVAIIGGALARWSKTPKVVGYLIAGILLRVIVRQFAQSDESVHHLATGLSTLKSVALGLIMFSIGQVFEARHLRAVGRQVLRLSSMEISAVLLLVSACCLVAAWWSLPRLSGEVVAFSLLLGTVAVATAPAATLFVLNEYDAKGPTTDTMLTLTALNNVASIVLFHAAFLIFATSGWVQRQSPHEHAILLDLVSVSAGSIAIGILLGFLCSVIYAKLATREFVMVLLAALLLIAFVNQLAREHLNLPLNYLLMCLFLGATFTNTALDQDALYDALGLIGAPIYAAFFVLAGFELHLDELLDLGLIGAAYALARTIGKVAGGHFGQRWFKLPDEIRPYLGFGLLCQAGVAIGLADYAHHHWVTLVDTQAVAHPLAVKLKTVVLGSVVVFEIAGPLALKQVAVRGGEVKAITLLRRHRQPVSIRTSAWRSTVDALMRVIRVAKAPAGGSGALTVRHIMRTNIKLLSASATFDEVLRFVESSRYNDFPVVDASNQYVGMIRFSDLRDILYDPVMRELVAASDLVVADVPKVNPDVRLETLFVKFASVDIGALPVVESKESLRVIGVVEQRDLLRALHTPGDGRG